ncbi:MAG TPA: methyltransferase domain-containing protein [Myxococcaceae bacterium]|nr:methyltransferase domain-containing protein [Myxococcaceae bacterium]
MSDQRAPRDVFTVAPAYEAYMGRWSRPVAREFVHWLAVPAGRRWLDVGCGTGALSEVLMKAGGASTVVGVDRSAGFVEHARHLGLTAEMRFLEGDAQALPVSSGDFDAVVSGLVLNFVPDRARMVAEMARAARPGGVVALYVWDMSGGMELVARCWEAVKQVDPGAEAHDESARFRAICAPDPLAALFAATGLEDVTTRSIDVPTVFRDFDDYWKPFLGGQGPASAYLVSLPEERRTAVRETLRARLTPGPEEAIRMNARAWAVRGRAPGPLVGRTAATTA